MKKLLLVIAGTYFLVSSVQAASFDCAKAQTEVERLICESPDLGKLDEKLAAIYENVIKSGNQAQSIKKSQGEWLRDRNECIEASCLKQAYSDRIFELSSPRQTQSDPCDGGGSWQIRDCAIQRSAQETVLLRKSLARLSKAYPVELRKKLAASQEAWVRYTEAQCEIESNPENDPMLESGLINFKYANASYCLKRLAEERRAAVDRLFQCLQHREQKDCQ